MPVNHAALQRSLGALSFGIAREMEDRKKGLGKTALRERDQHFQIPIAGTAVETIVWANVECTFRVEFVNATGQRDSPYTKPQVAFGYLIESGGPVRISAYVAQWRVDDGDSVTGALLKVGADTGDDSIKKFRGKLHASFTGYGAPSDAEQEET